MSLEVCLIYARGILFIPPLLKALKLVITASALGSLSFGIFNSERNPDLFIYEKERRTHFNY